MTTRGNKDGNEPRSAPGPEGRREGGSDLGADAGRGVVDDASERALFWVSRREEGTL